VNDLPEHAGLYIHIPFCKGKCNYCHFYSSNHLELIKPYIKALLHELRLYKSFPQSPGKSREAGGAVDAGAHICDTIYFGGGTPSLLDTSDFELILEGLDEHFQISPDSEITVELNPADRDLSWFKALKSLGINRLNLGTQSFDDDILRFLGRRHTVAEATASIETAVKAGFENIGLDLIYGIPGQDLASWVQTLSKALTFIPAHLSCYELSIEEGTPLSRKHQNGDFSLPDEDLQWDFFRTTSEVLVNAGYVHYEVSNFARDASLASRHNQKYWHHTPYLGLGPAAHSFSNDKRWWNVDSVTDYIDRLSSGLTPVAGSEHLTRDQLCLETLFLGLRMRRGLDIHRLKEQYDYDLLKTNQALVGKLVSEGFITYENGLLQTTLKGFAIADRLAVSLWEGRL